MKNSIYGDGDGDEDEDEDEKYYLLGWGLKILFIRMRMGNIIYFELNIIYGDEDQEMLFASSLNLSPK